MVDAQLVTVLSSIADAIDRNDVGRAQAIVAAALARMRDERQKAMLPPPPAMRHGANSVFRHRLDPADWCKSP